MAVVELQELKKHNVSFEANGVGTIKTVDVRDTVFGTLGEFSQYVTEARTGKLKDSKGKLMNPVDLPLERALKMYYGCTPQTFLHQLGINTQNMTLVDACRELGYDNLNISSFESIMVDHSNGMSFETNISGGEGNTVSVNPDHRFIIPELISAAIRTGYVHGAMHMNWIASTQSMNKRTITMPRIMRGDGMPSKIAEGGDIPMGSVQFGQKEAKVHKVGTGFRITDELITESTLDILFIFLQEVGNDMAIGADSLALDILLNGEQADGTESAPVIGVDAIGTFAYRDLKRGFTRGTRLGCSYERLITGEEDGIDITSIDRFEGFDGGTRLASVRSIIGVPDNFDIDTHVPPNDQIVMVCPNRAMVKLMHRGMMTERRRNPKNQTEELYITDFIGFAIVKRDARLIVDKSLDYATNGFPDFMDIDSRIRESFRQF